MKRATLLLCLAGLLSACGADDGSAPATLPPVSAPATATAVAPPGGAVPMSAGQAQVPRPAEADAFTSEGAAAFVRYYVEVLNTAIATNDVTRLQELSAPQCGGCRDYTQSIQKTLAAGGVVESGRLDVLNAVAPAIQDDETTVLMDFTTTAYLSRTSDGRELDRFPAEGRRSAELRCTRRGDTWQVMGLRLASAQ